MSFKFVDSFRAGPGWNCSFGCIVKKFFTMHGHTNTKNSLHT